METRSKRSIPIARPSFAGDEIESIKMALERGWVSQGPTVERFEQAVAEYVGCRHAVAISSCTTGLHVAALIHGIGPGDEVICPSYTFIATSNGMRHAGADAQFVDIDPLTLNIDPALTAEFIAENYSSELRNRKTGKKLKAILIVHQIGIAADIDAFKSLADKYGIVLLEDSACGIGSEYKGTKLGGSGNLNVLSFHPRKVITTGEGGMILTDDAELAEKARVYRGHGASISDYVRHSSDTPLYESYNVVGYNYRMTDIQAALGLSQLAMLDSFVRRRIEIATRYNEAFRKLENIRLIAAPGYATLWNYQSYPIILEGASREERDEMMTVLAQNGVSTRRGIPPIHKEPAYNYDLTLKHTERLSDTSIFLPIFPQMDEDDVAYVIEHVEKAVRSVGKKF
ncbi:MAG TPA: DegT/DnrJ/EryC1/StrS aminotransferase family protein [Candidatus Obscuribacterales bacterium]